MELHLVQEVVKMLRVETLKKNRNDTMEVPKVIEDAELPIPEEDPDTSVTLYTHKIEYHAYPNKRTLSSYDTKVIKRSQVDSVTRGYPKTIDKTKR